MKSVPRRAYSTPIPPGIEIIRELEPGKAFAVKELPGRDVVQSWSYSVSGNVYLGDYYLTHTAGHHSEVYLLDRRIDRQTGEVLDDTLDKVIRSRAVTQQITGLDNAGWTFSQHARAINRWLDIWQLPSRNFRALLPTWHYQLCKSGFYEDCSMYDLTAAYWQTVERVESPRVRITDGRLQYVPVSVEQMKRWQRLKRLIVTLNAPKPLRLMLVGVNAAGWQSAEESGFKSTSNFCRGVEQKPKNLHGALQPLALLAVRCTYELCQIQAEAARAVYANADCVVIDSRLRPTYWEQLGVDFKLKAAGHTTLRQMASYRVGNVQTRLFDRDDRYRILFDARPKPIENPYLHLQVFGGQKP